MVVFRNQLASIFTDKEVISRLVVISVPLMALCCFGDYTQCISAAVIRAMGKQKYLPLSVILSYWVITLPLTYYFAFTLEWGIQGIMVGLPVGLTVLSLVSLYIIFSQNFSKVAEETLERMEKDKQNLNN